MFFYTLIGADIWKRFDTKIDTHTTHTKNKNTLMWKSDLRDHPFWLQNVVGVKGDELRWSRLREVSQDRFCCNNKVIIWYIKIEIKRCFKLFLYNSEIHIFFKKAITKRKTIRNGGTHILDRLLQKICFNK